MEPLLDFLQLSPLFRRQILFSPRFILNLPRRLAEKMEKNTLNDPIFKQFVPLIDETEKNAHYLLDPVQDQSFQKTKKLLQKYNGRALFVTTSACAMHCRFCFRQNYPYETESDHFEKELSYLAQDATIEEVILSGGDPLSLSDDKLLHLLTAFNQIDSIKRIRFHTRFPIGIPERINASFLDVLKSSKKQILFAIHVNHAKELDDEILFALKQIQHLGIPLLSQSVLLKGVNDEKEALLMLTKTLMNAGIIPYYLHLLDPVQGAMHFDSNSKGIELIRYIQDNLSGFGVPRLVKEEPGKKSKMFLPICENGQNLGIPC